MGAEIQSGIGHDLAIYLHGRGYNVALSSRRLKEGTTNANRLDPSGETAIFVQCDVSCYSDQLHLFKVIWSKRSRLDVLIANANITALSSHYNLTRRDIDIDDVPPVPDLRCTDIDFKGVVYGTELAVHYMRHNPSAAGGKIIVTASILSIYPNPMLPEYCAAKAAALQWVRTIAPMLLLKEGITTNAVLPNAVDTPIVPGLHEGYQNEVITRPECLMGAYRVFVEDDANKVIGQAIETTFDKYFYQNVPVYNNGMVIERIDKVHEPWFKSVHNTTSDFDNAIKSPYAWKAKNMG